MIGWVRDRLGLLLVGAGFLTMTDECVVEVVEECASAIDETLGGPGRPAHPATLPRWDPGPR